MLRFESCKPPHYQTLLHYSPTGDVHGISFYAHPLWLNLEFNRKQTEKPKNSKSQCLQTGKNNTGKNIETTTEDGENMNSKHLIYDKVPNVK